MRAWQSWRGPVLLVISLLVLWQALYWVAGDMALRSPAQTLRLTIKMLSGPELWPHIEETSRAFVAAIFFAVTIGLGTGLVLGFGRLSGQIFEPMLVAIYSIPKLTLYPILLLTFGLGMSARSRSAPCMALSRSPCSRSAPSATSARS